MKAQCEQRVGGDVVGSQIFFSYRTGNPTIDKSGEFEYSPTVLNDLGQVSYLTIHEKAKTEKIKKTDKHKTRSAALALKVELKECTTVGFESATLKSNPKPSTWHH